MKSLREYIMEAMDELPEYKYENDKVKVVLLYNSSLDSNLNLINGANKACILVNPKDEKGYIRINGGTTYNSPGTWKSLNDIPGYKDVDWKDAEDVELNYKYAGEEGGSHKNLTTVKYAEVERPFVGHLYIENDKTTNVQKHTRYANVDVEEFINKLKKDGLL